MTVSADDISTNELANRAEQSTSKLSHCLLAFYCRDLQSLLTDLANRLYQLGSVEKERDALKAAIDQLVSNEVYQTPWVDGPWRIQNEQDVLGSVFNNFPSRYAAEAAYRKAKGLPEAVEPEQGPNDDV